MQEACKDEVFDIILLDLQACICAGAGFSSPFTYIAGCPTTAKKALPCRR
jgi:hypothetical protein